MVVRNSSPVGSVTVPVPSSVPVRLCDKPVLSFPVSYFSEQSLYFYPPFEEGKIKVVRKLWFEGMSMLNSTKYISQPIVTTRQSITQHFIYIQ